eukprot:403376785
MIGSVFFAGWTLFCLIMPRFSDLYGRKIVYQISMFGILITSLLLTFSSNLTQIVILTFIMGCFQVGRSALAFLYQQELMPKKFKTISGTVNYVIYGLVPLWIVLYFLYISNNWIYLHIFGVAVLILIAIGTLVMPESPQYYLSKRQYDKARKELTYIARFNRIKNHQEIFENSKFQQEIDQQNSFQQISSNTCESTQILEEAQYNGSLRDIIKVRSNFINLIAMTFLWTSTSFTYYLINFQLKYLSGDIFSNAIASALSEAPAYIAQGYTYSRLGIKKSFYLYLGIAMIGSIGIFTFSNKEEMLDQNSINQYVLPIMILLAKAGVSAAFNVCYFATSNIFPTIYSGTAMGICNFFAKSLTMMSPIIAEINDPIPTLVLIGMCILSIFVTFAINETNK